MRLTRRHSDAAERQDVDREQIWRAAQVQPIMHRRRPPGWGLTIVCATARPHLDQRAGAAPSLLAWPKCCLGDCKVFVSGLGRPNALACRAGGRSDAGRGQCPAPRSPRAGRCRQCRFECPANACKPQKGAGKAWGSREGGAHQCGHAPSQDFLSSFGRLSPPPLAGFPPARPPAQWLTTGGVGSRWRRRRQCTPDGTGVSPGRCGRHRGRCCCAARSRRRRTQAIWREGHRWGPAGQKIAAPQASLQRGRPSAPHVSVQRAVPRRRVHNLPAGRPASCASAPRDRLASHRRLCLLPWQLACHARGAVRDCRGSVRHCRVQISRVGGSESK